MSLISKMPAPKNRSYRSSKKSSFRKSRNRSRRASRRAQRRSRTARKSRSRVRLYRVGKSRRRRTRIKSRSRRNHRGKSRRRSRRLSTRNTISRAIDAPVGNRLLKSNPFIKCKFPANNQELILKPPAPNSSLPSPPESQGSTFWINVPYQASYSLTVDDNNNPILKTDENGAYEVVLPNFSISVLLSEHEDLARELGLDPSGSLAIAVPTGSVATWNPSYKNDSEYESVYTINNSNGSNPDGAWMMYAPLELPKTPPPDGQKPTTIDNIPAVQRITVDGKRMLKFRFQVPIIYPLPEAQGGGSIDIQEKLNSLEDGQKLRLNMLYPPGLPLAEQRTIAVEIGKDQGPGTFVGFQLPESLWDDSERQRIVSEQEADENYGNVHDIITVVVAVAVAGIFVYNIPNLIRLTQALGSLLYSTIDAGFQPAREYFNRKRIKMPDISSVGSVQTSLDRMVQSAQTSAAKYGRAPSGFEPYNVDGLSEMTVNDQVRWFSNNSIPRTDGKRTYFEAVFMDIQSWDARQANGFEEAGKRFEGIYPDALEQIAKRNPVAFSFIGRKAREPWTWRKDKLRRMIEGIKNEPGRVEQLMVSIRAGTHKSKLNELGANYEAVKAELRLDYLPSFEDISSRSDEFENLIATEGYTGTEDGAFQLYKTQSDISKGTAEEQGNMFHLIDDLGGRLKPGELARLSPRARISPRLARLMKRYKSIQKNL